MEPGFTNPGWADLRGCTKPFGLAAPYVFIKQSPSPCHCDLRPLPTPPAYAGVMVQGLRHPFYRRYGANLPISLGRGIPHRLSLLSQGTCVGSRYGHRGSFPSGFSRAPGIGRTPHTRSPSPFHPLLLITRLRGLTGLACVGLPQGVTRGACVAARTPVVGEY